MPRVWTFSTESQWGQGEREKKRSHKTAPKSKRPVYSIVLRHSVAPGFVRQRGIKPARRGFPFTPCTEERGSCPTRQFLRDFLKNPSCFLANEPVCESCEVVLRQLSNACEISLGKKPNPDVSRQIYLAQWWRASWCSRTLLFFL